MSIEHMGSRGREVPAIPTHDTPVHIPAVFDEDWWLDAAAPGAWDRVRVDDREGAEHEQRHRRVA